MDGDATLDAMIARLRSLRDFREECAKEAAPLIERELRAQAAAGVDPDGKAWPLKRDGARALPNVAASITVAPVGETVVATLTGGAVYHHKAKGEDQRRVLPDSGAGIPPRIVDALTEGSRRAFRRLMGGGA